MARHLQLIGTDFPAWLALLTPDAIIEFPYAASLGTPRRAQGPDAIAAYMKSFGGNVGPFEFSKIDIMGSADGNKAWASFHGEALANTGCLYSQDYAAFMEVRGGQIAFYKEFWNPCRVAHALGWPLVLDEAAGPQA